MNELINLLKSPQFKAFGWVVTGCVVVAVGGYVYQQYMSTAVIRQNYYINKFKLSELQELNKNKNLITSEKEMKEMQNLSFNPDF